VVEILVQGTLFSGATELPVAERDAEEDGAGGHDRGKGPWRKTLAAPIQHRAILPHPNKHWGGAMPGIKWLVLVIFFAIILSLVSAMVHLVHDYKGESKRMVRALTLRIGLSITLFFVLWLTWKLGWIEPHRAGG
jgi:hypothetical protein